MMVSGISGAGSSRVNAMQTTDSVSRNIQNEVAKLQKEMQELSSNEDLSVEEKMEKRQELQKQIFELQNQLRQHEIEMRKEAQQKDGASMEEMLGGDRKTEQAADEQANGISDAGMEAMISADSALTQAKTQGSLATKLKGSAGVLEGEIKLDAGRGGNAEEKKAELADIEKRAMQASASQIRGLSNAVKEMKDAAQEEGTNAQDISESQQAGAPEEASAQQTDMMQNAVEAGLSAQLSGESMAEKYNPVDVLC